jgi:hypothetical protein
MRVRRHFLAQFGPCLKWPWTKLTNVVDLDEALIEKIAAQSDKQAAGLSIRELERIRDENLVGILQALKAGRDGEGLRRGIRPVIAGRRAGLDVRHPAAARRNPSRAGQHAGLSKNGSKANTHMSENIEPVCFTKL